MLSGIRRQNGSPGTCWGRIFAVSVEGDILSFSVYIRGPQNSELNVYRLFLRESSMTVLDNAIFMVVKFDIFSSREQTMSRRRHGTKTLVLRPELANKTGISKIRSLRGCQCASHHWGSIYLDCRDHILLDALRPILILGVVSVKGGT